MPSLKSSSSAADLADLADLADPDPDVRIRAVLALASSPAAGDPGPNGDPGPGGHSRVADRLASIVLGDLDPGVVAVAIGALARLLGHGCETALCQARDRFPGNPAITHAVTRALTALDQQRR